MPSPVDIHRWHFLLVLKIAFVFLFVVVPTCLRAETISGTIQDPSGAVVVGARIEITGGDLLQPLVLASDSSGKFVSPQLKLGEYSVRVMQDGFESLVKAVDLQASVELKLVLAIAEERVSVSVTGKSLAFANSDPLYRQLREIGLGETFRCDNYSLSSDVATFQLEKGTLTRLSPVDGVVTGAIFIGEGRFTLQPVTRLDTRELSRRTGSAEASEDFTEVVFRFTREAWGRFLPGLGEKTGTPPEAAAVFNHWREKVRHRREYALGFTQYLLQGETMENVDADLLAALYNRAHPEFFNAYLRGKKHKDLRFFLRNHMGAVPQLNSPEEVALINFDPEGSQDGVWYLAHLKSEYSSHTASSLEDRRLFATRRYKIETVISKNEHLTSTATITFKPLIIGERVLKFGLLPNLRVTRVTDGQGRDLYFIQESRKEDGSFYAILPNAPDAGKEFSITVEYTGDKVLEEAGDGSFYVSARSSWYPNLNGFIEKVLYDLTFEVPRKYKVISVGKLQTESTQKDLAVSNWTTPFPVAVAGFNYGDYKKKELPDEITGYRISGYYLTDLPTVLRPYAKSAFLQSMAPGSMTEYALEQTRAQLQLCTYYFGRSPYEDIYITEQPNFNFGQSWPNLVYLPIAAYMDSTQRWMLFGRPDNRFTGFVQEVTPHEVAHQWWGHAVGWASYHDQWLSEGFAEFSAGLFLQHAVGKDWRKDYIEFWKRLRERLLETNINRIAPNDAGPLWMGLRLISPHTEDAYQNVTYTKGAYVLEMLRSMMYSTQDQDKEFIAMMHDFVESHRDRAATTESFKAIAEKHITKLMDLDGNGRLDWFFDEWVYGTQVPRYHFEYQLAPADGGKVRLRMTITQSEVDEKFAMLVPLFADFGDGMVRIGQAKIAGSTKHSVDIVLPNRPKKVALNAYKEILER
ncbi:MAG: M1 family aminopeptidase [Candidatus Acidiferrum sp.]